MGVRRYILITVIYFCIFVVISGCSQQENGQTRTKEAFNKTVPDYSYQNQNVNTIKFQSDNTKGNVGSRSNTEQKQDISKMQFSFYPSGPDFINSIIDKRGKVKITEKMRHRFNKFARDYRFVYLPEMNYYESFFNANQYAKSFGYTNFGFTVFYVLQYMNNPEKISNEEMQNAIQSLFVAKETYKDMPHQAYQKLVNYQDGYYSLWPEGELDPNRMFYLLTELDISRESPDSIYITVRTKNYYFNDISVYEAGENEKLLAGKSKELGATDVQVAEKLIESGKMEEFEVNSELELKIHIKLTGQKSSYLPRFVSIRKVYN